MSSSGPRPTGPRRGKPQVGPLIAEAEQKAEQIVAEAMARADRIRAESERELAAATQRRDSINAQLTNVRQMLARCPARARRPTC